MSCIWRQLALLRDSWQTMCKKVKRPPELQLLQLLWNKLHTLYAVDSVSSCLLSNQTRAGHKCAAKPSHTIPVLPRTMILHAALQPTSSSRRFLGAATRLMCCSKASSIYWKTCAYQPRDPCPSMALVCFDRCTNRRHNTHGSEPACQHADTHPKFMPSPISSNLPSRLLQATTTSHPMQP